MNASTKKWVMAVGVSLMIATVGYGAPPPGVARGDSSTRPDDPVECRVSIDTGAIAVEVIITDSKVIRELVLDPIEKAVVDMKPAKYVVMGSVTVKRRDGSEGGFVFFSPWGHCKKGGKYLIALQKVLKDALKRADDHLVGP